MSNETSRGKTDIFNKAKNTKIFSKTVSKSKIAALMIIISSIIFTINVNVLNT